MFSLVDAGVLLDQEQLLRPGDFGIDQELLRDLRLGDVVRDFARVILTEVDLPRLLLRFLELSRDLLLDRDFRLDLLLERRDLDLDLLPRLLLRVRLCFLLRDLVFLLRFALEPDLDRFLETDLLFRRPRDLE